VVEKEHDRTTKEITDLLDVLKERITLTPYLQEAELFRGQYEEQLIYLAVTEKATAEQYRAWLKRDWGRS
jgi:hypothetical protein